MLSQFIAHFFELVCILQCSAPADFALPWLLMLLHHGTLACCNTDCLSLFFLLSQCTERDFGALQLYILVDDGRTTGLLFWLDWNILIRVLHRSSASVTYLPSSAYCTQCIGTSQGGQLYPVFKQCGRNSFYLGHSLIGLEILGTVTHPVISSWATWYLLNSYWKLKS